MTGDLERKATALFDESVERLDGRTRSRLTQARNRAVDELRSGAVRRRWLRGPTGLAAAMVVGAAVMLWAGVSRNPVPGAIPLDDLEIVADADDLELLQDVEFYAWLEPK
ncbi:MAG: hypothetical protein ACREUC_22030 [Steroidobacteraceae bacterium]